MSYSTKSIHFCKDPTIFLKSQRNTTPDLYCSDFNNIARACAKIFGGSDTSTTIFLEGPINIVSDICCSDSSIILSQFLCVRFWRIPHGHNSIFGGFDQHSYQTYVARILQKCFYICPSIEDPPKAMQWIRHNRYNNIFRWSN